MIEEFRDPLENYDPKEYADPTERALAEDPVTSIQHSPFTTISPDTTISEALAIMTSLDVSCLMVEQGGKLEGVFSERDALLKVATNIAELGSHPVSEMMTTNPIWVHETSASASALCVMAVRGHRHVPIVDLDGKIKGIVSPQRVTEFLTSKLGGA